MKEIISSVLFNYGPLDAGLSIHIVLIRKVAGQVGRPEIHGGGEVVEIALNYVIKNTIINFQNKKRDALQKKYIKCVIMNSSSMQINIITHFKQKRFSIEKL